MNLLTLYHIKKCFCKTIFIKECKKLPPKFLDNGIKDDGIFCIWTLHPKMKSCSYCYESMNHLFNDGYYFIFLYIFYILN